MATERLCSVEGCGKPHEARGWCKLHYYRWKKHGDVGPRPKRKRRDPAPCTVGGCGTEQYLRGYCNAHYLHWRRHGDPMGGGSRQSAPGVALQWMQDHLNFDGDECLIWPFGRSACGRGALRENGRQTTAHRWVCERVYGAPPAPEYEAAHNCGNGHLACVNRKHLYWATPVQNAADRWVHGTQPHGEGAPNVRLTETEVLEIYGMRGVKSHEALAKQFGVTKGAIGGIMSGRTWNWLTGAVSNDFYSARRSAKRMGRSSSRAKAAA